MITLMQEVVNFIWEGRGRRWTVINICGRARLVCMLSQLLYSGHLKISGAKCFVESEWI